MPLTDLSPSHVLPVSDAALPATEGASAWRTTRKVLNIYDATRERALGSAGFQPYAFQIGGGPTMTPTVAVALAANGGSIAIPIALDGHMLLDGVTVRSTDTATARTAEWRLYEDRNNGSNTLNEIAGANGTWSFTPSAASNRASAAVSAPVYLAPGLYWLVIRNTSAAQTFGLGSQAAGTMALSTAQTKTLGTALGATLDFVAATWTKVTALYGAVLTGRVFGQSVAF